MHRTYLKKLGSLGVVDRAALNQSTITENHETVQQAILDWERDKTYPDGTPKTEPIPWYSIERRSECSLLKDFVSKLFPNNMVVTYALLPGVHKANADGTLEVALTERDMLNCRTHTMRVGRYLNRLPEYTADQANSKANEWISYCKLLKGVRVQWAHSESEIVRVYTNGPRSCMSDPYYSGPVHPATVYATPDISVAFIETEGRITSRAVVNLIDSNYSCIYGNATMLREALTRMGFTHGSIDGCRIRSIPVDINTNLYVMPYIDGITSVSELDEDYLLADDYGDIYCSEVSGTSAPSRHACETCDSSVHEDDLMYIDGHIFCDTECAYDGGYIWACDIQEYISIEDSYYCETDNMSYYSMCELCDIDGAFYLIDSDGVRYSEDQDEYVLTRYATYIDCIDDWVDDNRKHEFIDGECEDEIQHTRYTSNATTHTCTAQA